MMELTEDFIKMLQIAFFVIGALSIFLIFINYNIIVTHNDARRNAFIFGDYLLGSSCLAITYDSNVVKGLFSESKLNEIESDTSCIKYTKGEVSISLLDGSRTWNFILEEPKMDESVNFSVAVILETGAVKPAKITVKL